MTDAIPPKMKAVWLNGFGDFDQLEYREDVATPTPGAGEVLISVGAAGVNNTDINTRAGWYAKQVTSETKATGFAQAEVDNGGWNGETPRFPRIQGADACGRIVAVGAGVDSARFGERVLVEPVFRLPEGVAYFGSERDGAFAQFCVAPSAYAHRVESALGDVELASFPCAYSAAENMVARASIGVGETVLVTGASGGVGAAAVQLCRRRGAEVIGVCSPGKVDYVVSLGASRAIADTGDLARDSLDAVIDVVGGPSFPSLLDALKPGGRLAIAGAIAGPLVEIDLRTLYLKDISLFGCTALGADVFKNLVGYIERGEIRPLVGATFPLRDIVEAQKAFASKRVMGKIVLRVKG